MVEKTVSEETTRATIVLSLGMKSKLHAIQGELIATSRKTISFSNVIEWLLKEELGDKGLKQIVNILASNNLKEIRAKNVK